MEFKNITFKDLDTLKKYLNKSNSYSYCNTPTTFFMWQKLMEYKIYESANKDYLIIMFLNNTFYIPFGNIELGLKDLTEHCKQKSTKLKIIASEGERMTRCLKFFKQQNIYLKIGEVPEEFEYIYNTLDLIELKGKKYHSKRNHITNFIKTYNFTFEILNEKNQQEFLNLSEQWCKEKNSNDHTVEIEQDAIKMLINKKNELGIFGGAIRVNGKLAAFSLASEINEETADIHVEKALKDFPNAYTVINNCFAKEVLSKYKYINREDDMGLEGLRKAKLSYHPCKILKKYLLKEN